MSRKRFGTAGLIALGTLAWLPAPAASADLLSRRHTHADGNDYACPTREPYVYRPRIASYDPPLCYAARPYGISTHLYDHPSALIRGVGAREGY